MKETPVLPLGREDPLEESMATHSSILAWRIPCTEEPGGLQSMGFQRVGYDYSDLLWPPPAKSWLIGKDWCWEGLGAGGEGDDRGWDGWMASPTRWPWVWVNSGSWWWTGRPGVLQFMGLQRVGHDWATELNWTKSDLAQNSTACTLYIHTIYVCIWIYIVCIYYIYVQKY